MTIIVISSDITLNLNVLVVSQVCDGISDCPSGSDETMCNTRIRQICPGALYCRLDDICVHLHQVCDGISDCRLSDDDESMCDKRTCADGCTCIGETMICTSMNETNFVSLHTHFHGLHVSTCIDFLRHLHKFPNLYYLSLSDIKLLFSVRYFASLASLRALLLSNITLTTIPGQFFHGLSNLTVLRIVSSNLGVVHKLAFSELVNIKHLNLSRQNIRTIHECAFCQMESLQVLDLSFNNIKTLSCGLLDVQHVVTINLSGNTLHTINRRAMSPNVMPTFDHPKYCCFVQVGTRCFPKISNRELFCLPLPKSKALLVFLLLITFSLFATNAFVCLLYMKTKDHKFYLIQNLAFSDGCLSIYFFGLISLLFITDKDSVLAQEVWMSSSKCTFLSGILALSIMNSKTTCCLMAINYVLITKYALKKYSFGKFKHLVLLLTVWVVCAGVAFTYSVFIEVQSALCVPFNANRKSSYGHILFNALFIIYLSICDGLMMYLYVLVYRCLRTSAIKSGRPNKSYVKVRNRAVASCCVYLSTTVGTLLLSSQPVFNYQFGIKYELYVIMIVALSPLSNPFIHTLSNKLVIHKSKRG